MAFSPQPHLWNPNLDFQYLPRCMTCCKLLKVADPSSWSGNWQLGVVWYWGNERRNVWINNLRCILASATFGRINHAKVAVASVVSRLPPNSRDSKLYGSLFSPVPTCNIADIIINYINVKRRNFTHYLIQGMILTFNIFSYSTLTYVENFVNCSSLNCSRSKSLKFNKIKHCHLSEQKLFSLPSRVFLQYWHVKWGTQNLSWSPTDRSMPCMPRTFYDMLSRNTFSLLSL